VNFCNKQGKIKLVAEDQPRWGPCSWHSLLIY